MHRAIKALVVIALLGLLAGCTEDDARTDAARLVAADLARGLAARDLGGLPVDAQAQEQLAAIVSGVDGIPMEVTLAGVSVDGDSATADLDWQWQTAGGPWSYRSAADLAWSEDRWTVTWSPDVVEPSLVAGESLDLATERAERSDILGAGDVALVTSRRVVRFGIDKTRVSPGAAVRSARSLARLLGVAPDEYADRVQQAGPKAFVPALVLRAADARDVDAAALDAIPAASAVRDAMQLAPTREFAAPILGRVGPATREIVEDSLGAVEAGDEVGLSGLQARYDDLLGGTPGITVSATGGEEDRVLFRTDAVAGQPLRTTLDLRLQRQAEAALAEIGSASALVAVRPSTGDILAAASGPGSNGYNTATYGQYAPGSTMKVVTALALMREGVKPSDTIPCTFTVTVDGKRFTNYDAYPASRMGRISLESAVANSCNTALISQRDRLTDADLGRAAAALGLGVDHDLGFPAYFGQVPEPTSETGKAAALIGQGTVLASPMAMAAVAASVAQGDTVVPRLLPDRPVEAAEPPKPLKAKEAAALRDMMRAVVTEGTSTFLRDVPGPPVGAKTGTAEFGTATPPRTHAWMMAFQGDLAVAVFVEDGDSGSGTAGPILERFLRAAR